ncbi:MAG TPA: UDP-N-acetylmuramate dehydrogenase [Candidatus Deferrimicrobiaceae bacterium]|nr:UDP-N-acetylmuramate dehydrogenase [Candidatus Deferrimicrobiaceae bacterium]
MTERSGTEGAGRGRGSTSATPLDLAALAGEIARRVGVKAERNARLGRLTTMRVGGPADLLVVAHNAFELRALVRFARTRELPLLLLGRGSNVVISDRGVRGLVVHVRAEGSRIEGVEYVAEAGVPMARAATETQKAGLTGLEFGLAIPGTVGGAVWANAGAHGSDVASILVHADVLVADGSEQRLATPDLQFAYRDSRFKHGPPERPDDVVLVARFRLTPASAPDIRARLDDIRRWRQAHQPLGLPSAGSTFRNPAAGPSAGELIDGAGLKGFRIGGATVSEKHANFIVNDARGSATDVRRLVDHVHDAVLARAGVDLMPEIVFAGDWNGWPWPAEEEA